MLRHSFLVVFLLAVSLIFGAPAIAVGAVLPYQAEVSAGAVTLNTGENKLITLKFKNTGSTTWIGGKAATAVYLYGDSSVFRHPSWLKTDLPAVIKEKSVKPGGMASVSFYVTAPQKAGIYMERFLLSYAPNSWIKGSVVTVNFNVVRSKSVATLAPPPVPTSTAVSASGAKTTDSVPVSTVYKAELLEKGGSEWQLMPGEHTLIDVKFKNIGTQTWKREGGSYISLYTWVPKYRISPFKDMSWKSDAQAASLVESEVKPGKIGTIRLELRAPETPGSYTEAFQLAAEDAAWVDGGEVSFKIKVVETNATLSKQAIGNGQQATANSYAGMLMLTSHKSVILSGNERLQITHGFKNSGEASWNTRGVRFSGVSPSLGVYSSVRDESWLSSFEPVKITETTPPGQIGFVTYTLKAPARKGDYTVKFKLVADGQEVPGTEVEIPVTVTADGSFESILPDDPSGAGGSDPLPLTGDFSTLGDEPIIRVGLYKTTDDAMHVRGISTGMVAMQDGTTICTFKAGEIAVAQFSRTDLKYTLTGPGCSQTSSAWYVLAAEDGLSPLEITDYSRPIAWLSGSNDNKFRAKLELRHTPATKSVWVINELSLESYLNGIAETSNVSPLEYQKALLTAARTYALYHVNRGTKHANEFYHVDAHLDQVYRGYGQEARSPNIVDGVTKTRGQIVTYDGKLAITPYYSRSDGRTRDWTEVWGGSGFAWLKSVPVPHDVGQTLWGHGVGLSARGALYMASKDGALYDAILKHFYVGTELRRAYK